MRTKADKATEVEVLREKLERAHALVLLDYRGLTVADANDLRGRLRKSAGSNVEYRVAKNTLLKIASRGTQAEVLGPHFTGPTAVAVTYDEPAALAKTLVDYAKSNEKLGIRVGLVEGELIDLATIRRLADLPTKDQLRGMLAGMVQAPLRNLAGTLQALLGNLRNALEQRQKQIETQG